MISLEPLVEEDFQCFIQPLHDSQHSDIRATESLFLLQIGSEQVE